MDALAYSIKEAARLLNLSTRTVEGMIARGELPIARFGATGRAVRISHATLVSILAERQEVRSPKE